MTEVDYTAGYNIMAHLGKGKAILGLKATGIAGAETITTPFARCVPVAAPGTTDAAANAYSLTEAAGLVTMIQDAGTIPATMYVIIVGDLH